MNPKYTAHDIANWFLTKDSMTPKKIQKLVYYAYSWMLTLSNDTKDNLQNQLFEEKIEAWVHGPVVPELYREYSSYGYMEIPKKEKCDTVFTNEVNNLLESVWMVYGGYDGNELESITHQESPWQKAREGYGPLDNCNEIISDNEIFDCYIQRIA
ncbi:hypothetical protein CKN96_15725 [Carnobacterium maltaromaticum]|uniref:Panacea domain-containing protein n=1 Tax=Carnobacterium maltaromaticum TaxID=2751 RepID=UPI0010742372|nr:type II toxin-antitoxin system antitoxin SocA domain-containing protein [Carnobacterium maltaromaticum]TFJ56031.1 hypothetical protein CKN96_15725 [Carnobacterium maltaromaticum]